MARDCLKHRKISRTYKGAERNIMEYLSRKHGTYVLKRYLGELWRRLVGKTPMFRVLSV